MTLIENLAPIKQMLLIRFTQCI